MKVFIHLINYILLTCAGTKGRHFVHGPSRNRTLDHWRRKTTSSIINGVPSARRDFYVKVYPDSRDRERFCGGTYIGSQWILTAATCVVGIDEYAIVVEAGDFSNRYALKIKYFVEKTFIPSEFKQRSTPENNIALIKTIVPIKEAKSIPLCKYDPDLGSLLGFCGMGSTLATTQKLPKVLQELPLYESVFERPNPFHWVSCKENEICVEEVLEHSNICINDEGGPLFATACDDEGFSFRPSCLYGIASHFLTDSNKVIVEDIGSRASLSSTSSKSRRMSSESMSSFSGSPLMSGDSWDSGRRSSSPDSVDAEWCNDGSVFTRVLNFHKWITYTIAFN